MGRLAFRSQSEQTTSKKMKHGFQNLLKSFFAPQGEK
jgi:hypothetical protein